MSENNQEKFQRKPFEELFTTQDLELLRRLVFDLGTDILATSSEEDRLRLVEDFGAILEEIYAQENLFLSRRRQ